MRKLHYHPESTYARRVRIALIEKSIPHELVYVNMAKPRREHRGPAYLALNPYSRVPTLQEDGFVLFESAAILMYLEATHPEPPLLPQDLRQRALADMHMRLADIQFGRPATHIIFQKRFLPPERWDKKVIAEARQEIEKHLAIVERQLGDREYMVADRYTLVEVCYTPFVEFLPLMEITPPPAVAAWSQRMLARPSALETRPSI